MPNHKNVSQPDGTLYEGSIRARVKRSTKWSSKTPASVSLDLELSDGAVRVYSVVTLKTKGKACSTGVRYLAKILNRSKSEIARCIQELVRNGHLQRIEGHRGSRAQFTIVSPAYPNAGYCGDCGANRKDLRESGMCWVCDERMATARTA